MKLLIFVLNQTEKLDAILTEFAQKNICGATILDGTGMARMLTHRHGEDEIPFLNNLFSFLNPEREKSKVVLAAIADDELDEAVRVIENVVGDLSKKDTGIVFTVPIDFAKGICKLGK